MIREYPRAQERGLLWLAKVASGVLIFLLLMLHLAVNHLVVAGGLLTYADVLAYYANPIIPAIEGLFLLSVIGHALLGVRGMVLDMSPPAAVMRFVDAGLVVVAAGASAYGLWLLITLAMRAG